MEKSNFLSSSTLMLTVEPMFGLSNRMQAVDSAISLAQRLRRPLTIIWNLNPELNCRFDDLFQIPSAATTLHQPMRARLKFYSGPFVTVGLPGTNYPGFIGKNPFVNACLAATERWGMGWLPRMILRGMRRLNQQLAIRSQHERVIYEGEMDRLMSEHFDFESLARFGSVYVRAWQHFYPATPRLSHLCPAPALQALVDAKVATFGEYMVGVHIRRTDHTVSRAVSTTERFMALMTDEVVRQPRVSFFLATDDPDEEATLMQVFPNRIITYRKRTIDRNTTEGIQDALVDLYCLARTRRILGTVGSTFSRAAATLGNLDLVGAR